MSNQFYYDEDKWGKIWSISITMSDDDLYEFEVVSESYGAVGGSACIFRGYKDILNLVSDLKQFLVTGELRGGRTFTKDEWEKEMRRPRKWRIEEGRYMVSETGCVVDVGYNPSPELMSMAIKKINGGRI